MTSGGCGVESYKAFSAPRRRPELTQCRNRGKELMNAVRKRGKRSSQKRSGREGDGRPYRGDSCVSSGVAKGTEVQRGLSRGTPNSAELKRIESNKRQKEQAWS